MTVINSNVAETLNISENGTYDVSNYTGAVVNTPAAPDDYIKLETSNGFLKHTSDVSFIKPNTKVGTGVYTNLFRSVTFPSTNVDLRNIVRIFGDEACYNMFHNTRSTPSDAGLTVDLSNLKELVGARAFSNNGGSNVFRYLFDSLEKIGGSQLFQFSFNSTVTGGPTTVSMPKLTTISSIGSPFQQFCTNNRYNAVYFPSLNSIKVGSVFSSGFASGTAFSAMSFPSLRTDSFGSYSNQFNNMVSGKTGFVFHFPKNLDPTGGSTAISGLTGYPNFGGTSTVLTFDLPSTFILTGANSVEYERNPKDDTGAALSWRIKQYDSDGFVVDWTPFYTSGLTDPTVGTTIYSDAECTTSVTTVASIS